MEESELLAALTLLIEKGLEVRDEDGCNVSAWNGAYTLQYADRGCVEYASAEEAAKAFLSRWS
jgi:hypothetical protein